MMNLRTLKYADMDLERPIAIIGFPSVGLVSSIASNFCVGKLEMQPIAGMTSPEMPPYCLMSNGQALPPVRFYGRKGTGKKGRDAIVCMSEYTPKPEHCYDLSMYILNYLRSMGCEELVCLEGVPRFSDDDGMVVCGNGPNSQKMMRKTKLTVMENGMVRGITGIMLYSAPSAGMDVVALIAPANQSMPDPGSAAGFLGPLSKIVTSFKVDSQPLLDEAEEIQKRIDQQESVHSDDTQFYG